MENPAEHVFERLLRAEAQGESADSYAGESGGHIHAQVAQHQQGHQQKMETSVKRRMSETMERSASIPRFVKLTPMRAEMARVMRVSIQ